MFWTVDAISNCIRYLVEISFCMEDSLLLPRSWLGGGGVCVCFGGLSLVWVWVFFLRIKNSLKIFFFFFFKIKGNV